MDRIAPIVLGIVSTLIVMACVLGGEAGQWAFAVATPLVPVALIALGGSRRGGGRRFGGVLLVLTLALEAGSIGIMVLSRSGSDGSSSAGLPPATLVMLVALGVVPLLLIPVSYAALFRATDES